MLSTLSSYVLLTMINHGDVNMLSKIVLTLGSRAATSSYLDSPEVQTLITKLPY